MLGRPLIRPLVPEDTGAIVSLYDRAMQSEPNIGPVPPEQWERFVRTPYNHYGRDFRVTVIGGLVVGLAESHLKEQTDGYVRHVKLVVDPAHRRHGLATEMLRALLALDDINASVTLHGQTREGWAAGEGFLAAMGFQYLESDFSMICRELLPIAVKADDGVSFARASDPVAHAADVARIHNAAFASDVAFFVVTAEDMAEDLRNEGDDLWLARDGNEIIGFCRIEMDDAGPWLESIAIAPAYQARGIGPRLAHHVLATYGISAQRRVGLSVSSNNPNARRVYTRLGFMERTEKRRYATSCLALRRRLAGASDGA
jgi:mycothiol synthase